MHNWHTGDVHTNGISIHYYRTNNGKPPLVLAHGLTDSGPCWLPVFAPLADTYDVVVYDARGHGHSDKPTTGYSFDQHAADLAGLINALGLTQPVVVGHSMGGATAALMAALNPGVVRALILEDPAVARDVPLDQAQQLAEQWRAETREEQSLSREALIARERFRSPKWSEAELGPWADAKFQVSPATMEVVYAPSTSWEALLDQITCPILLITGEPELNVVVQPAIAAELQQHWRNGTLVRIAGAGHCVRRDQPAAYLAAVHEFLAMV